MNGAVVVSKLSSAGQYTEDLVKHVRLFKFTLPDVREGSVIEFTYTVIGPYDISLQPWQFQHDIPVRWSECRISYPEFFDYKTVLQGYQPLKVREQSEGSTIIAERPVRTWNYRWAMQNVPAFAAEPFITTPRDYVARLDFELSSVQFPKMGGLVMAGQDFTTTWEKIDAMLLKDEDFGLQLDRGGFLKDELAKLPVAGTIPLRAAAVHAMVRDAVKFDDREGIRTTVPLRKTYLELHRGSAADINLLLIAALRTAGVEANPVLLSTRDHGHMNVAFPLASRFNYVIAHVALPDGQDLLLDATEPLLAAGALPERCLNQVGRVVLKEPAQSQWIELKPGQRKAHFQQVQLTLTPQGAFNGKVHEEYYGYAAASTRAELRKVGEAKYRGQLAGKHSDWAIPTFAVGSRDELTKPVALDYEFIQKADGQSAPLPSLYLTLMEEFSPAQNPFRHAVRTYPVDFGMAQEEVIVISLTLPEGYELVEQPKGAIVELPNDGGRYLYGINVADRNVQLTSRLTLRKPIYEAEDYTYLRELYRIMLEKQAEKLVVHKKA